MCPFCLASMGLIVASATSAGGLTALAVKLSQRKSRDTKSLPTQVKVARQAKTAESAWQESQASRLMPASKA
jgi:hypothetical protein